MPVAAQTHGLRPRRVHPGAGPGSPLGAALLPLVTLVWLKHRILFEE